MKRVSGWYKRRSQCVLLSIGLIVASVLNIDTCQIVKSLWKDPVLRESVVMQATELTKQQEETLKTGIPEDGLKRITRQQMLLKKSLDQLAESNIPMGWKSKQINEWYWHLPGILLTAFAVSLGAPFWFDLLNKLARLRGASERPKTTEEREEGKAE